MNEKQKVLFKVITVAAVLMGLIPPWTNVINYQDVHLEHPAGYGFIFDPPASKLTGGNVPVSVKVDVARLLVQWATLALAGVGGYFSFRDRDGKHGAVI